MKIKNIELAMFVNILQEYSNKKLPHTISYAITRNLLSLEEEIKCYTSEINKIIDAYKEYQVKDDNGNTVIMTGQDIPLVDKEHIESYGREIANFLQFEVDVNLYTIDISCFNYDSGERFDILTASDILKLQSVLCKYQKNGVDEK